MFKQGTHREYTESTDSKVESRAKSEINESNKTEDNIKQNENVQKVDGTVTSQFSGAQNLSVDKKICISCSFELENSWKSCPNCGVQIQNRCSNCNEELKANWSSCPMCGLKT